MRYTYIIHKISFFAPYLLICQNHNLNLSFPSTPVYPLLPQGAKGIFESLPKEFPQLLIANC